MAAPSTQTPGLAEATQAELQVLVQTYIDSAIKTATDGSKKRLRLADAEAEGPLSETKGYSGFGRIYSRQDDPFTKVDKVVNFGITHETAEEESDDEQQALSTADARLLHSWRLLCSIIPDFCKEMLRLAEDRKTRKAACQQIYHGATMVRSDDTSSLKAHMPSYILVNPNNPLVPPIAMKSKHKYDRGFNHPATASLLCPVKYPNTAQTYADIKAGKLPLTATLLPRFLFPDGHVHDPTDISKGLFRGHIMFRTAKHIFQGPSSALDEPGAHRGKQGNAALCDITSLTPRMIAYVAIQASYPRTNIMARFALSSATSWSQKDGTFSYKDFYWHIVGLLEDSEDLENIETMKLFNYHVFGAEHPDGHIPPDVAEVENEYELIKEQRAAKRARLSS